MSQATERLPLVGLEEGQAKKHKKTKTSFGRKTMHKATADYLPLVGPENSKASRKEIPAAGRFAPASRLILQ